MNDVVKKKGKKFILIILMFMATLILLIIIFGLVDYFRAKNGKKPIFIYHTINKTEIDITTRGFEDTTFSNKLGATYYGLGYTISICDNQTKNYTFELGRKSSKDCYSELTCTKTLSENDKQSFDYDFFDGKLVRMFTTKIVPAEQITNEENYEKEFMKVNSIKGCNGTFKKLNETTYETKQGCNIAKMPNRDVRKVYSVSKQSLRKTKNEIIDSYASDKKVICK